MEKLLQYITTNWSTILEYALVGVSYFLVFLYNSKVNNTKMNLHDALKTALEDVYKKANALLTQDRRLKRLEDTVEALIAYKHDEANLEEVEQHERVDCEEQ